MAAPKLQLFKDIGIGQQFKYRDQSYTKTEKTNILVDGVAAGFSNAISNGNVTGFGDNTPVNFDYPTTEQFITYGGVKSEPLYYLFQPGV